MEEKSIDKCLCDSCIYYPPSSMDGKPCCMCDTEDIHLDCYCERDQGDIMDNYYYSANDILDNARGTDAYFQIKSILTSTKAADVEPVVRCKDCKNLMFSDFYGECWKGYMGIVRPDDFCSNGKRKD